MPEGLLVIRRPVQFTGFIRRYRLYVRDRFVGRIGVGGEVQLPLATGEYQLTVRLDWVRRTLPVVIRRGQSIEVEVGADATWFRFPLYARLRVVGFPVAAVNAASGVRGPGAG